MKKVLAVVLVAGSVVGLTGCGKSEPTLTKEQIVAVEQVKQLQDQMKALEENRKEQQEILKTILDASVKKEATVDGEKQTEYTFTNTTGSDVEWFQLGWEEFDQAGNKKGDNVSPISGGIKAGAQFKLNSRLSQGAVTLKVTKLTTSGEWTVK